MDIPTKTTQNEKYLPPKRSESPVKHLDLNKQLDLPPSRFFHGCVCGHHVEIRDLICDQRKRPFRHGVTIKPKTQAIGIKLR